MRTAIRVLTLLVLSSISYPGFTIDDGSTPPRSSVDSMTAAWGFSHITLVRKGQKMDRGYALYTTSDRVPGIAFRCHREKLYALISVKPVSFRKLLSDWFRNPAEWQVEYRIEGDEPRVESWIWTYEGRVFMSRPGASANNLFHAARRGADIDFKRKRGDPIRIDVPPSDVDRFDSFMEKCGLAQTDLRSPGN